MGQFLDSEANQNPGANETKAAPRGRFLDEDLAPASGMGPGNVLAGERTPSATTPPLTGAALIGRGLQMSGMGATPGSAQAFEEAQKGGSASAVGAMAGNAAAGLIPGMRYLPRPLSRVLGGAIGGGVGSYLQGEEPLEGAAKGAGTGIVGEGLGAVGGKILRSAPGAKGRIAGQDAARYAEEMGRQSPPLAGAKTADELRALAAGPGRERLGAAKEAAVQDIERQLPQLQPPTRVNVPAMAPTETMIHVQSPQYSAHDVNPISTFQSVTQQISALAPTTTINVPVLGGAMPLREANNRLSEIGAKAFSKNPLDRNFNGVDQRRLYGQVANEIEAGLPQQLRPLWQQAQGDYKKGLALLKPLQASSAYRQYPDEIQFNTPQIQTFLANPKNEAALRNKLGDGGYEALVNAMTRGGGVGTRDILAPGQGRVLDALRQTLGRGTNTGSMQALGVPARTLFPNLGSQYAGRQPYTLPPALQTILDAALQGSRLAAP